MLNPDECKALLKMLDRVPITGHVERNTMNVLVRAIAAQIEQASQANKLAKEGQEE